MDIFFEEARTGMFVIKLFEARGLRNVDPLGQQRPYVLATYGNDVSKRSKCVDNSPVEPYFAEEELCVWSDKRNWMEDLRLDILDEDIGMAKTIGGISKSLLPYMNYSTPLAEAVLETSSLGGAGELVYKVSYRFYAYQYLSSLADYVFAWRDS